MRRARKYSHALDQIELRIQAVEARVPMQRVLRGQLWAMLASMPVPDDDRAEMLRRAERCDPIVDGDPLLPGFLRETDLDQHVAAAEHTVPGADAGTGGT